MDAGKDDTRRAGAQPGTVPGLGPVPTPRAEAPPRLDPSRDPDRYDAEHDTAPAGRLDPAQDPDRYDPADDTPPGQGQTLPDLLGEGAYEDKRDNYQWAIGLLGIIAFLALVSWFFTSVATP